MDESRKCFENTMREKFGDSLDYRICRNGDGGYFSWDMQVAWYAWTTSRAAIEIELPEVCAFNLCELLDKKEVIEAIRAAGIKVKE